MKSNFKIFWMAFLFMALSLKVFAATPETELKALLSEVNTLQGNFQQQIVNGKGAVLQKSAGKMWLKKPGQFRWEVKGKDQRVVVADGKQIWDYDVDLEQVTVQKLSKGQAAAPIFFLTGETAALARDFTIMAVESKGQCLKDSDQCFELKPKQQQGSFQWIRLGFKHKALKELELLDQLGQHSFFQFDQVVLNS